MSVVYPSAPLKPVRLSPFPNLKKPPPTTTHSLKHCFMISPPGTGLRGSSKTHPKTGILTASPTQVAVQLWLKTCSDGSPRGQPDSVLGTSHAQKIPLCFKFGSAAIKACPRELWGK